ncbi:MAG: hypothetical protein P4L31_04800, partial [Candidatus Babeliales bacterium]|nr:hypothetical protein [Candidatus Babeliales bacterium]
MKIIKNLLITIIGSLACLIFASRPSELPESYKFNAQMQSPEMFNNLKLLKQCNTDWATARASSKPYRQLCYEALSNLGHHHPELVMLTSQRDEESCLDPREFTGKEAIAGGCIITTPEGKLEIGRGIRFFEPYWNTQSYGARKMALFHEAWHMVAKHYYKNIKNTDYSALQKDEKDADKAAIIAGKCVQCAREFCQWLLDINTHEPRYTIKDFDTLSLEQINTRIESLEPQSLAKKSAHPLSLERALRIYRYTRIPIKELADNASCPYHQAQKEALLAKIKAAHAQQE